MKAVKGDKRRKGEERWLFIGVSVVWKSDGNPACLVYLSLPSEMLFLLLTALRLCVCVCVCVCVCAPVCLCAGFIYMHICVPMTSPQNNVRVFCVVCACVAVCVFAYS